MSRIIGVDPGGQATGIVVMDWPDTYVQSFLVLRSRLDLDAYIAAVVEALQAAEDFFPKTGGTPPVAVEDVIEPNPHLNLVAVRGILDTAQVLGAIRWHSRNSLTVIRPRRHGSLPLSAYPKQLVGPTEKKGTGVLRHCRSAWDIARLGGQLLRRNQRLQQQGEEP